MSKIKEYFQNLVKAGIIPQSPMNYDAEALKIYIDHLEEENAALRTELEDYKIEERRAERISKYRREDARGGAGKIGGGCLEHLGR